jgi:hypothetical protein
MCLKYGRIRAGRRQWGIIAAISGAAAADPAGDRGGPPQPIATIAGCWRWMASGFRSGT